MNSKRKKLHLLQRVISIAVVFVLAITFLGIPGSDQVVTATELQSYIVQGPDLDIVESLVIANGGEVTSRLDIIDGVGAVLPTTAIDRLLAEPGITAITLNAQVKLSGLGNGEPVPSTEYPDVIGADIVWDEGVTGAGITVALVDTGIGWHNGLFKDTDGNVKGRIVGWNDLVDGKPKPHDPNGHGTHIAGVIANTQIGSDEEWGGIAPGVNLVGVRVLDEEGLGSYESVIQGVQWVIDHKDEFGIKVLNLSLISEVQSPYWADPLNQAVSHAWAEGITVVVASGNGGPEPMTVGVPGNNPYVITVGAFTDNHTPDDWSDDYIAPFSAAGPTLDGFVKPDVVAPGAHMVSTMMPGSHVSREHLANQVTSRYFSMAGTSQAAASVSGLAALILSQNPDLSPDQVKYRVMFTSFPWMDSESSDALYSIWQQGTGRINAPDAVFAEMEGAANSGMDIIADLNDTVHYEGYSYYDTESGQFKLRDEFGDWANGYGAWSGGYGAWSGGYGAWSGGYGAWSGGYGAWSGGYGAWSGGYGAWSGGYGAWSGGYGAWSGGYGAWSGGYGAWSGGYGAWSGGYGAWSGGYGAWSGSEPWYGSILSNANFIVDYLAGSSPDTTSSTTSITDWVDEP